MAPVEPGQEQLEALAALVAAAPDEPIVMLNLNRYRERARYEGEVPGGGSPDVSGYEAYLRYGEFALRVLEKVGGSVMWHTQVKATLIGDESDVFHEVLAVRYPGPAAFAAFASDPEIVAAMAHRRAGLERAALICCEPGGA
jgi:uncharacterized protein (DUF1330 family)